ncbi:MAG: HlyD family efflux transporter periplasmic adaptor subunit [Pseudonocardiales bacterium]|nr:HlyD family efflux transporter periplasmic adaptor subunit [Pseudonocardiales bacterium]
MTMIFISSSTLSPARRSGTRVVAALGLVTVLSAAAACGTAPPPPPTGRVERAPVATRVSAAGSLAAIRVQNLGFSAPASGRATRLKQLMVKVGDRVTPGQVLALEDDFAFRQVLNQLQGQLNAQQALLDEALNDTTVHGDQASLEQARRVLEATEKLVDAQLDADASTIRSDHKQLDFDSYTLDRARDRLRADQLSCAASGGVPATSPPPSVSPPPATAPSPSTAPSPGISPLPSTSPTPPGGGSPSPSQPGSSVGVGPAQAGVDDPVKAGPVSAGTTGSGITGSRPVRTGNSTCNNIPQDQTNVANAQQLVMTDKATLVANQQKENVDRAQGQVSIEQARQNVVTAQNNLQFAATNRPFTIDQQAGLVANLAAQVASAQRDVDNTVLHAPVAGTVSAINGTVGEYIIPGNSNGFTVPLAPGSQAPIPGLNGQTQNSLSLGGTTTGPQRPGGTQFLVLSDVNSFQVVVPFEEADAAKISPNQKVDVTFDAIPDLTRTGTVLSIAPSGSTISSVINYYVTIVLNETDPRLKDGLTSQARVVTNEVDDVLTVPNSAVRRRGDQSTVTLVNPNGTQEQVRFQAGLVGDDRTQVISGLREGQEVLLRQGV